MRFKPTFTAIIGLGVLLSTAQASAQTLTVYTGHINRVFTSVPGNMGFRVFLDAGVGDCSNNFAFVDTDFGNYQVYVSTLLTAYSQHKRVQLITQKYEHGGSQFCQIVELSVDDG